MELLQFVREIMLKERYQLSCLSGELVKSQSPPTGDAVVDFRLVITIMANKFADFDLLLLFIVSIFCV